MKRLLGKAGVMLLLIGCMLIGSLSFSMPVSAASKYTVSEIQADGSLKTIGGFEDFYQAEAEMKKYPNGVITADFAYSRTKYIAMTRGIAVSYSFRRSINGDYLTMPIFQYEPGKNVKNAKQTYVASHNEMQYYNTVWNSSDGWMVHVNLGGFDGYAYLQQVDLIPYIYFENGLPINLGGGSLDDPSELFTITPHRARFEVRNGEIFFVRNSLYNDRVTHNLAMGPADEAWMENGKTYYSNDFIHYYTDIACTQNEHTYYNYYMFLPVRSKSFCNPATFDSYIQQKTGGDSVMAANGTAKIFFDCQDQYGINALLLYSLATHESGWGASYIAKTKYNLFGWSAYDANTGAATEYTGVADCVSQMAGMNMRRYTETDSVLFFGAYFGTKGSGFNVKYASDPYWGLQVACRAYMFDKMNGLVDYKYYKISVINDANGFKEPLRTQANSSSAVSFYANYGSTYQKNHVLLLVGEENGFYQVQSSSDLNADKTLPAYDAYQMRTYNFLNSTLYVAKDKVSVISSSKYNPAGAVARVKGELLNGGNRVGINYVTYSQTGLNVAGYGYQRGIASRDNGDIVHELILRNVDSGKEYAYALSNTAVNTNENVAEMAYEMTGFEGKGIQIDNIDAGTYEILLRVKYPRLAYYFDTDITASAPDTSGLGGSLKFKNENGNLFLTIGTTVKENQKTTGSIKAINWDTESNKLHIVGTAVIQGIDHTAKDRITRELVIYDVNSDFEKVYELSVNSHNDGIEGSYEYILMDSANYLYAWYENYLDLSDLPDGDYRALIRMSVNDGNGTIYSGSTTLSQTQIGYVPDRYALDTNGDGAKDKAISIDKVIRELSVYEINVSTLDGSLIDQAVSVRKPTHRNTNYSLFEMSISDDNKLYLNGYVYLYGVNHTADNPPVYKLFFVKDGKLVREETMTVNEGLYDIDSMLVNSEYSYKMSWFEHTTDLSTLEKGTYELYISEDISDGTNSYHEFFQLYDSYQEHAKKVNNFEVAETSGNGRISLIVS